MSPQYFATAGTKTIGAVTVNYTQGPPAWYFGNIFAFYRGGFKVKVKLVKTNLQTGRLQFTYTPNNSITPTGPTLASAMLAQRWIVDISVSDEIDIIIPYQNNLNYVPVATILGNLDVIVVTALRGPETCSPTLDVLFYACGADDLEFAFPGSYNYGTAFQPFSPQMGLDDAGADNVAISGVIGNAPAKTMTSHYSAFSNGEMFSSIKQLLNRYHPISQKTFVTAVLDLSIWPWLSNIAYMTPVTGTVTAGNAGYDTYSCMTVMYAYYRGSMRVQLRSPADNIAAWVDTYTGTVGNVIDTYAMAEYGGSLVAPSCAGVGKGMAITDKSIGLSSYHVPYYSRTRGSFTAQQTTSNTIPIDPSQPPLQLILHATAVGTINTGVFITRATGEDFYLSYFLGCPPVISSIA